MPSRTELIHDSEEKAAINRRGLSNLAGLNNDVPPQSAVRTEAPMKQYLDKTENRLARCARSNAVPSVLQA
jgi:hypothetical protein